MEPDKGNAKTEEQYSSITLPDKVLNRIKVIEDVPSAPKKTADDGPSDKHTQKQEQQAESQTAESISKQEKKTPPNESEPQKTVRPDELKQAKKETEKPTQREKPDAQSVAAVKAPEVSMTRNEIQGILAKADMYRDLISRLLTEEGDSSVRKAVDTYCEHSYNLALSSMPVEELNFRKSGIRVGALRSYGYTSIASIKNMSFNELMYVKGIGEKSAQLILRERAELMGIARNKVSLRPRPGNTDEERTVVACYRYFELYKLYKQNYPKYSSIDNAICQMKGNIGKCSRIAWLAMSHDKKESAVKAAKELEAYLSTGLLSQINMELQKAENIRNASAQMCFAGYGRDTENYNSLLQRYVNEWKVSPSKKNLTNKNEKSDDDEDNDSTNWKILLLIIAAVVVIVLMICP